MDEINRPKRTTRPPAWHATMAALTSTSSDDAERQMTRSLRPAFQLDLSELRATVEERIIIGKGGKKRTIKIEHPNDNDIDKGTNNNGYETARINDVQDNVPVEHNNGYNETDTLHDVYDDGNETGQVNDGYETLSHDVYDDGDKTEQTNDGYETLQLHDVYDDGNETEQIKDGYETVRPIDRNDDDHEIKQMTETNNDGNETQTMALKPSSPTPEMSGSGDRDIKKIWKEMRKMNRVMEEKFETWDRNFSLIRDFIEGQQQSSAYPTKPDCLPMKSVGDIEAFENSSAEAHREVIQYLDNLGGCDAKRCASVMIKEAIHDKLSMKINYYGRHQGTFTLENTKLSRAFYKAMCRTLGRESIPLTEFSAAIMTALRAAKQRRRNTKERRRNRAAQNPDDALT